MARVIAQANSLAELRTASVDVPPGSSGCIIIEGPGIGIAADLPGAEIAWRRALGQHGFSVTDVHGQGISTAVVEWTANSGATANQASCGWGHAQGAQYALQAAGPLLIVAIVAALLLLGWVLVKQITVLLNDLPKAAMPILLIMGAALLLMVVSGKRRRAT